MIRKIQIVLVTLCLFLFFFLAVVLLCRMAPWFPLSNFGNQVIESIPTGVQVVLLFAAAVMILVVALLEVRKLREEVHITKQSEDGSVTIVESAITRYIRQVAMEIDAVQSVRSEIASTREGLVVDLYARVLVTDTLPQIEQRIRSKVKEAIEETLGVGGVAAINVVIENFQKAPPAKPEREAAPEAPAAAPEAETPAEEKEDAESRWVRLIGHPKSEDGESESEQQAPEPRPSEGEN